MPARIAVLFATLVTLALPASAPAITGGEPATRDYRYMAALTDGSGEWAGCGASLVRADWALTAAHCVEGEKAENLGVRVGTHDISTPEGGEVIGATKVIVHERYGDEDNTSLSSFDVALLQLERPATQGAPIRIAAPPEKAIWADGKTATVTGWGGTFYPGIGGVNTTEDQLMEVDVPMVSDERCASYFYGQGDLSDLTVGEFDPETMVCAGEDLGGSDSCSGDSGGPLVVPDASGALVQVGVVSWGNGCAYPLNYGVYSRIADDPLYSWIQGHLPAAAATSIAPAPVPAPAGPTGGGASTSTAPPRASTARTARTTRKKLTLAQRRCIARAGKVRGKAKRRRALKRCTAKRPRKSRTARRR